MAKTIAPLPAALVKTKLEGTKLLTPLEKEVRGLQVLTPEQYLEADSILAGILRTRAEWKAKMYGTPTKPGPIPLQRASLESLYELNRSIDGPIETLERAVRKLMADYKVEEQRQLQAAEQERRQREEAARQELEAAAQRASQARTAKGKAIAEAAIDKALAAVEELEAEDIPTAVEANSSSSRTVKRWRIRDVVAIIAAVVDGKVDVEALTVDISWVEQQFRKGAKVGEWPGFEVYEDTQIVKRRA